MARLIKTEKEVEGRYTEQWVVVEEDVLEQWPAGPGDTVGVWILTILGVILMIVGALGLLLSLVFWSSWGGFGGARDGSGGQNTTIVERDRT